MNGLTNPNVFREQLKKFIVDNGIIGTAAGVSIAVVTKEVIQSLAGDIILPSIYSLLVTLNITSATKLIPGKNAVDLANFIKQFISWVLVIIITFMFVRVAFQSLFGVDDTIKADASSPPSVAQQQSTVGVISGTTAYGSYKNPVARK
jgi:large-conductance mechanosensitive channel